MIVQYSILKRPTAFSSGGRTYVLPVPTAGLHRNLSLFISTIFSLHSPPGSISRYQLLLFATEHSLFFHYFSLFFFRSSAPPSISSPYLLFSPTINVRLFKRQLLFLFLFLSYTYFHSHPFEPSGSIITRSTSSSDPLASLLSNFRFILWIVASRLPNSLEYTIYYYLLRIFTIQRSLVSTVIRTIHLH